MSTETHGGANYCIEGRVTLPQDEDPEDPLFAIADAIRELANAVAQIAHHVAMQRIEAKEKEE